MSEKKKCMRCSGTGMIPCRGCSGKGVEKTEIRKGQTKISSCAGCNGSGSVICGICNGSGEQ